MTAQIASAAQTRTVWRAIAWQSRARDWSSPNCSFPNPDSSPAGHRRPAALISRAFAQIRPSGTQQ